MADKFAIVTGASTGIGYELAKLAAENGYDVLGVADTPFDTPLAGNAETLNADLSTIEGVDQLLAKAGSRKVDLLCANAGHGLGRAFLDQDVADWRHVVDTNITGTIYLLQKVLPADGVAQRRQGAGDRISRGLHPRRVPGGLQWHQGVRGQLHRGAAQRAEGRRWRHADHADAGSGRNRVLRARRHDGHLGRYRPQQERSCRCRQGWLGRG